MVRTAASFASRSLRSVTVRSGLRGYSRTTRRASTQNGSLANCRRGGRCANSKNCSSGSRTSSGAVVPGGFGFASLALAALIFSARALILISCAFGCSAISLSNTSRLVSPNASDSTFPSWSNACPMSVLKGVGASRDEALRSFGPFRVFHAAITRHRLLKSRQRHASRHRARPLGDDRRPSRCLRLPLLLHAVEAERGQRQDRGDVRVRRLARRHRLPDLRERLPAGRPTLGILQAQGYLKVVG